MEGLITSADEGFVLLLGDLYKLHTLEVARALHERLWANHFRPTATNPIIIAEYRAQPDRLALVRDVIADLLAAIEAPYRQVIEKRYGLTDGIVRTNAEVMTDLAISAGVLLNRREAAFARLYGKNRGRLQLLLPDYFHVPVAEIRAKIERIPIVT